MVRGKTSKNDSVTIKGVEIKCDPVFDIAQVHTVDSEVCEKSDLLKHQFKTQVVTHGFNITIPRLKVESTSYRLLSNNTNTSQCQKEEVICIKQEIGEFKGWTEEESETGINKEVICIKREIEEFKGWIKEESTTGINEEVISVKQETEELDWTKEESETGIDKELTCIKQEIDQFKGWPEEESEIDIDKVIQEQTFDCEVCKTSNLTEDQFKTHVANHPIVIKLLKINDTGRQLLSNSTNTTQNTAKLSLIKNKRPGGKFTCDLCSSYFMTKKKLRIHIDNHLYPKPYKYGSCNKLFVKQSKCCSSRINSDIQSLLRDLRARMKTEHRCQYCFMMFTSKWNLRRHILNIHGNGVKPVRVTCSLCAKVFTNKNGLRDHMNIHNNTRKFVCDYCEYNSTKRDALLFHLEKHKMLKNFKCERCSNRYSNQTILNMHMNMHLNKRNKRIFICDYCMKIFNKKKNLESHIFTHTGQRPFKCTYCPKRYTSRKTLLTHINTHTKEKIFQCDYCSKICTRRYLLKLHKINKHLKDPK